MYIVLSTFDGTGRINYCQLDGPIVVLSNDVVPAARVEKREDCMGESYMYKQLFCTSSCTTVCQLLIASNESIIVG